MSRAEDRPSIPITDFYGESTSWPLEDRIHCEPLKVRSSKHDWQIKPHRHQNLMQLFFVATGKGHAQVDNKSLTIHAGDLLVIPDQCVHTFHWEEDSNGYVLAIATPLQKTLQKLLDNPTWLQGSASLYHCAQDAGYLDSLLSSVYEEYCERKLHRQILMENRILSLAIWITREYQHNQAQSEPRKSRSEVHLNKYLDLVEQHFRKEHNVEWYAGHIGITAAHLNEICKRLRRQTALNIIHQRVIGEAQRDLIYTVKTAADIAHSIGFPDPAYFNRFFKRHTGMTPKAFRVEKTAR